MEEKLPDGSDLLFVGGIFLVWGLLSLAICLYLFLSTYSINSIIWEYN